MKTRLIEFTTSQIMHMNHNGQDTIIYNNEDDACKKDAHQL